VRAAEDGGKGDRFNFAVIDPVILSRVRRN
jgi:hypothetical protein